MNTRDDAFTPIFDKLGFTNVERIQFRKNFQDRHVRAYNLLLLVTDGDSLADEIGVP